jgi:hypothetical protein
VPLEACLEGLRRAKLTKGRLERKMIRGICILDDSYNANPDSMVAALETLGQMPGRRIAVLGQMNELGAESESGHRRVGEAAAREKIDCVITVGGIAAGSRRRRWSMGQAGARGGDDGRGGGVAAQDGAQRGHGADQGEPFGEDGNHCRGACPVMMYFLYHFRDSYSALNVFYYITFRSIAAAVTSFLISLMFGNWVIRRLIGLKVGQPIRTKEQVRELAELHGGKAGTPTMGGVLLLGSVIISTLLWARLTNHSIWLALFTIVYLGLLGFVDDYLKVTKKKSDGVHAKVKLVAQLALAGVVTAFFLSTHPSRCRRGLCMCHSTRSRLYSTLGGRRFFSLRWWWWEHRTR